VFKAIKSTQAKRKHINNTNTELQESTGKFTKVHEEKLNHKIKAVSSILQIHRAMN